MSFGAGVSELASKIREKGKKTLGIFERSNTPTKVTTRQPEESNDIPQQQKLESVVTDIVERLSNVESDFSSGISTHISPSINLKKEEIISEADKLLDSFQPPPKGHPEEMKKAILKDKTVLGSMLERLSQADDVLLKGVSEQLPGAERRDDLKSSERLTPESSVNEHFASTSSGAGILRNEESRHEQFEQKLALYTHGNYAPTIMIGISTMGSENGEATAHFIPLGHTFFALADTVVDFNSEDPLPDFWTKEIDHNYNTVTESGVRWEWQDPNTKVMDAMNKEGYLRLESVCKEVEYVVVLVKMGGIETGLPIEIPRSSRQAALAHFQQLFPGYLVSQVRRLPKGDDVRDVIFDRRSFAPQTNALFVELETVEKNLRKGKGVSIQDNDLEMTAGSGMDSRYPELSMGRMPRSAEKHALGGETEEPLTRKYIENEKEMTARVESPTSGGEDEYSPEVPGLVPATQDQWYSSSTSQQPTASQHLLVRRKKVAMEHSPEFGREIRMLERVMRRMSTIESLGSREGELSRRGTITTAGTIQSGPGKSAGTAQREGTNDSGNSVPMNSTAPTPTDIVTSAPITNMVDGHSDMHILPFMRIPYLRAQRNLELARGCQVLHLIIIHIARQALRLVLLLNDAAYTNGVTEDKLDEALTLRSELLQFEDVLQKWKIWGSSQGLPSPRDQILSEIKEYYDRFFNSRPAGYFERDDTSDRIYHRLVAYDIKEMSVWRDPETHDTPEEEADIA